MSPRQGRQLPASVHYLAQIVGPFVGLILVVSLFAFLTRDTGRYLTIDNIKAVAVQTAIIGTCGIGMTLIIIGGGIDLSVGSTVALAAVTVALVFNGDFFATITDTVFLGNRPLAWGAAVVVSLAVLLAIRVLDRSWWRAVVPVLLGWTAGYFVFHQSGSIAAVAAGILMGTACGLVNGLFVTGTRVVPFIITLGTMEIFRGTAQLIARGESVGVDSKVLREQHPLLRRLMAADPEPEWLVFGYGVWIMLIAGLVSMVILRRFRLGRYIFAIGSNEQAARLSGVAIHRIKLLMYSAAGMLAGVAGVMQFSRLSYGSSTAAVGLELDVIAAVVIGGGSLRGGEGSVVGTFIGAFIILFMRNGCDLAGIPNAVQRILVGFIIILAVAIDEFRHAKRRT